VSAAERPGTRLVLQYQGRLTQRYQRTRLDAPSAVAHPLRNVDDPAADPAPAPEPEDRRIRRTWRVFAGALVLFGLVLLLRAVVRGPEPLDAALAALLLAVGVAAVLNRSAVVALERRRRAEAESVTRLLRGLSRSVSPDAIVGAIAGELAAAVEADHVVVVRRRDEPPRLEATLVSRRPGVPDSTTSLPVSDLDPRNADRRAGGSAAIGRPIPVRADGLSADGSDARSQARPGAPGRRATATPRPRRTGAGIATAAGPAPEPSPAHRDVAEHVAMRVREVYALRETLAAPLVVDGEMAGAIVLSRRLAGPWPGSSSRLLDEAAGEASLALGRAISYRDAETRASTDALTGLPNRRYFEEFCGLLARRRRAGDAVGVLMIDIDHFKRLNDSLGHATGDEVLRVVGRAIAGAVREDDVPARIGGEEFAVLLRDPSPEVATQIGERVRRAVGALDLDPWGVPAVSVSVGVSVQSSPDEPITALVEAADRALYLAKRAGRDRVVAA
jgi:diguanylate cyclase (GGDEF)-like protein